LSRAFPKIWGEKMKRNDEQTEKIRRTVREGYAKVAQRSTGCGCGCGSPNQLAKTVGYTDDDLGALPDGANMGLSCGNPTALASLKPGEIVLDLGSGAGFDVFITASKVGPEGRVIGVDMTPDMLDLARKNGADFRKRTGMDNIEFRLGEIEHLPVADNSVDVVISNCVINLSPDKQQVWNEVARVLKPGGRVAVSDLALHQPLPQAVLDSVEALVSCVAGAALIDETDRMVRQAGLVDINLESKTEYIDQMDEWSDPLYREIISHLPKGKTLGDYVTSLYVNARKPAGCCCG